MARVGLADCIPDTYMVGLAIAGSIMLYPGGLDYIDSLFFAAGAATQSGLNTFVQWHSLDMTQRC